MAEFGSANAGDSSGRTDGRSLRREQNIDHAIDAFTFLIADQPEIPTLEQVAVQAGLSVSSVYRYFGHVDELFAQAAERGKERFSAILAQQLGAEVVDGPLEQRIEQYIAERATLRDASTDLSTKSVELFSDHRMSSYAVAAVRTMIRQRITEVSESELAESGSDDAREFQISAIYVAGSMTTRQYLLNECEYTAKQVDAFHAWQIAVALTSPLAI